MGGEVHGREHGGGHADWREGKRRESQDPRKVQIGSSSGVRHVSL